MHRSRAYLASILVVLFVLSSVAAAPGTTRDEIEAARQRAEQARDAAAQAEESARQYRAEAEALDNEIRDVSGQIRSLDPQIAQAAARTARLQSEVHDLESKIADKEVEIAETAAEYDFQQGVLNDRMLATYKQGNFFYLDLLLDSKTISDLITRTTLVQRVIASNNEIAIQLIHTREQLETAHNELERARETAATKRAEAAAVEKNLRAMRSQRESALSNQQVAQSQKTALMQASEADAERWKAQAEEEEAAAQRMEAELRAAASRGGGQYLGGVMAWPVPGGSLTSGYGPRVHPIFGTQSFHHGIDIGRGGGTIVAAGDGTVIRAEYGWNGGYGNIVVMDHGDGLTTLYAHILDGGIQVSHGQRMVKGEPIALVGSTGYSTGPHLHFEVRVNGASTDPLPYVQ